MKLRAYREEDSAVICSWLPDERSVCLWTADRIAKFPLAEDDLHKSYVSALESSHFIPLTAVDDLDRIMGHLLIRYPDETDDTTVRFGCVIVDPALRRRGTGKEMLQLAAAYARDKLHAHTVTLGVFAENLSARRCYEAAGFRPTGEIIPYQMPVGEWDCIEMELPLHTAQF